jgi:V/A-type H+-transporting ATPase subunit F
MDIVVVGEEDFTIGFRLAGVKRSIYAHYADEYEKALDRLLTDETAGIVIVPHHIMHELSSSLRRRIEETTQPVVFPLGEKKNIDIKNQIIKVVGVDLWK